MTWESYLTILSHTFLISERILVSTTQFYCKQRDTKDTLNDVGVSFHVFEMCTFIILMKSTNYLFNMCIFFCAFQ